MAEVVKTFGDARPASSLLREVSAVPTIFPVFDWRVEVGGLPIGKIVLVHGPSAEGKTPFTIGLGRSFLARDHFFDWIDAEHSTDAKWMRQMMGPLYTHPGFTAPQSIGGYEKVRAHVRRWCEGIGEAREKNRIPEDTTGVAVVDSIQNLLPEGVWDELRKSSTLAAEKARAAAKDSKRRKGKPKGHIDGAGGRVGQIQAGYNAAWVKELTPLLAETRTTLVIITRERAEEGEGFFSDEVITTIGGKDLKYASQLWLRIISEGVWHKKGDDPAKLAGHKHTIEIRRSKVGPHRHKIMSAWYHTSNGLLCPEGFDSARDVLDLGRELAVVEERGSHIYFDGEQLGNGEANVLTKLREDAGLLAALELECRKKFA